MSDDIVKRLLELHGKLNFVVDDIHAYPEMLEAVEALNTAQATITELTQELKLKDVFKASQLKLIHGLRATIIGLSKENYDLLLACGDTGAALDKAQATITEQAAEIEHWKGFSASSTNGKVFAQLQATITEQAGQLRNCVNHLHRAERRIGGFAECIESANRVLSRAAPKEKDYER